VVEAEPGALPAADTVIGIDLGLTHFAVLSDGRKVASPQFLPPGGEETPAGAAVAIA
jgi:putative transposase